MRKRRFLWLLASLPAMAAGVAARAQSPEFSQALAALAGAAPVREGRVRIEVPRLADNGNSVPLKVRIDGPADARAASITLLSERNPRPVMATFRFGPRAGHPVVSTRVRLNGTQRVHAIAKMADGSLWSASAEVEVTESACLDAS